MRKQCNPEERRCSRRRRRVCFKPKVIHSDEIEETRISRHQGGRIDLTATTPVATKPMPAQISAFDPYTVDLTRPSLVNIIARPSTPFMIDLTH